MNACFPYCTTEFFQNMSTLKGKNLLQIGANSFPYELTPIENGGKTDNDRVASPKSVPIYLEKCG